MPSFTPLALGKRDMPQNAAASGALTVTINGIATQAPFKSKAVAVEYWESLAAYCSRNIAELNGVGGTTAAKAAAPKVKGKVAKAGGGRG